MPDPVSEALPIATEALKGAERANTRIDGMEENVSGLRSDLRGHRDENAEQHRDNKKEMLGGFTRLHDRVDDIHRKIGRQHIAIIGLLVTVLGYLLANGLPWK